MISGEARVTVDLGRIDRKWQAVAEDASVVWDWREEAGEL